MSDRRGTIAKTFVELADTLVADFDLIDFLQSVVDSSREILGVDAVGLLLADNYGGLSVVAASSPQARMLELFQVQSHEGPCLDCYHTGRAVTTTDLAADLDRWPLFARRAIDSGVAAVHALPMRLREEVFGGMNLFTTAPGALDAELLQVGQALTNLAAVALLAERASGHQDLLIEQLQTTLNNRLAIEQAKGIIAERANVKIDKAFELLRRHALEGHQKISDLAVAVVRNDPTVIDWVVNGAQDRPPQE
jgi:GAF domain-containing protein